MKELPHSSLEQWRLKSDEGDHEWKFLNKKEAAKRPQSFQEKYFLGLKTDTPKLKRASKFGEAAENGYSFYQRLQMDDGHWECGYEGPSFLLPGIIFAMYITNTEVPPEWKSEIVRYLQNTVNEDGGWGFHTAGQSTSFATGLNYVMLRLFGIDKDVVLLQNAIDCFLSLGGAMGLPQWGKLWLALLNLYDWDGINPIPADLWILPEWMSVYPWRMSVQCRVFYLPASYLWSNKCSKELDPLLKEIRDEIFTEPFSTVNFSGNKWTVAASDAKKQPSTLLVLLIWLTFIWVTYLRPDWLLRRANKRIAELIHRDDEFTNHNCIAPINNALHLVAIYFIEGPKSSKLQLHRDRISQYLWLGEKGMTCSGTNGMQVLDTAFTIQAASEAGLTQHTEFRSSLEKAYKFLSFSQMPQNLPDPYQQPRAGEWPFSTRSNGCIVPDCTAESLKAVLMLHAAYWPIETNVLDFPKFAPPIFRINASRLETSVDSLLAMQNSDGGFGKYEKAKASAWIKLLNPADVFDCVMIDYSYPECTAAVLAGLAKYARIYPSHRYNQVQKVLRRAVRYLHKEQKADGSWYGSWGICFTYATFLVLVGLESVGEDFGSSGSVQLACEFLLSKQREDGGWGEHWSSCETGEYVEHPEKSQVVNTAWAVLALMYARYPDDEPIRRGLELIMSRQQPTGEWLQEDVEGVFNRTCMIGYPNYKYYFPIWALGKYAHSYQPMIKALKEVMGDDV